MYFNLCVEYPNGHPLSYLRKEEAVLTEGAGVRHLGLLPRLSQRTVAVNIKLCVCVWDNDNYHMHLL